MGTVFSLNLLRIPIKYECPQTNRSQYYLGGLGAPPIVYLAPPIVYWAPPIVYLTPPIVYFGILILIYFFRYILVSFFIRLLTNPSLSV